MFLNKFQSVACREYTLPRDDPASQPKGWIQGNMRIVEESYPTPHIHEQMTTSNYGYDTAYNITHNNTIMATTT